MADGVRTPRSRGSLCGLALLLLGGWGGVAPFAGPSFGFGLYTRPGLGLYLRPPVPVGCAWRGRTARRADRDGDAEPRVRRVLGLPRRARRSLVHRRRRGGHAAPRQSGRHDPHGQPARHRGPQRDPDEPGTVHRDRRPDRVLRGARARPVLDRGLPRLRRRADRGRRCREHRQALAARTAGYQAEPGRASSRTRLSSSTSYPPASTEPFPPEHSSSPPEQYPPADQYPAQQQRARAAWRRPVPAARSRSGSRQDPDSAPSTRARRAPSRQRRSRRPP